MSLPLTHIIFFSLSTTVTPFTGRQTEINSSIKNKINLWNKKTTYKITTVVVSYVLRPKPNIVWPYRPKYKFWVSEWLIEGKPGSCRSFTSKIKEALVISFNPFVHGRFSRPIIHEGGGALYDPNNPYWKGVQKL